MPSDEHYALLERIYEAGAIADCWPSVLHEIGRAAGGEGCVLLAANSNAAQWIASDGISELMTVWFRDGWSRHNTRGAHLLNANVAGFLRDIDIYETMDEIQQDPQIKDFLRPRGFGWAVGTMIPVPSGDNLIFSAERKFINGPVPDEAVARLNFLRPHLARAALFSARLGLERARAMTHALQALGLPAAVLRKGGRVLAMNGLLEHYIPRVFADRQGRLSVQNKRSDQLFGDAIAKIDSRGYEVLSIPIPAALDYPAIAVHLLPVCGNACDIFTQAGSIVIATPVDRSAVPTAELLQGLFDLAPAEARVARSIAKGLAVESIAKSNDTSVDTVRSQLKSIFAKTGSTRQSALTAMLGGIAAKFTNREE